MSDYNNALARELIHKTGMIKTNRLAIIKRLKLIGPTYKAAHAVSKSMAKIGAVLSVASLVYAFVKDGCRPGRSFQLAVVGLGASVMGTAAGTGLVTSALTGSGSLAGLIAPFLGVTFAGPVIIAVAAMAAGYLAATACEWIYQRLTFPQAG